MSQLRDDLFSVADLLDPEGAWTQRAYARNAKGASLWNLDGPNACSHCLVGAIEVVAGDDYRRELSMLRQLRVALGGPEFMLGLMQWNDAPDRTQAEVVALVRAAAEAVPS
jgi:hypothetical protein